jgi:hypothetical protein
MWIIWSEYEQYINQCKNLDKYNYNYNNTSNILKAIMVNINNN